MEQGVGSTGAFPLYRQALQNGPHGARPTDSSNGTITVFWSATGSMLRAARACVCAV